MMELRHFRHFVVLADEMHVERAAIRLGIAQPALSQQIKVLERQLGLQLFSRKSRRLTLTRVGEIFLKEARRTLQRENYAIQSVLRKGEADGQKIKLGYVDSAMLGTALPSVIKGYLSSHENVEIELCAHNVVDQIAALEQGVLDIAIVRGPLPLLSEEIQFDGFSRQELKVFMPRDHRLSQQIRVPIESLRREPFVTLSDPGEVGLAGQIERICQDSGFVPKIVQRAERIVTVASLVASGIGIALLPSQLCHVRLDNLEIRSLNVPVWSKLYLLSHASEYRSSVLSFLASWRYYHEEMMQLGISL